MRMPHSLLLTLIQSSTLRNFHLNNSSVLLWRKLLNKSWHTINSLTQNLLASEKCLVAVNLVILNFHISWPLTYLKCFQDPHGLLFLCVVPSSVLYSKSKLKKFKYRDSTIKHPISPEKDTVIWCHVAPGKLHCTFMRQWE